MNINAMQKFVTIGTNRDERATAVTPPSQSQQPLHIDMRQNTAVENQAAKSDKYDNLPPGIKKMLERIDEIKEQIRLFKVELEKIRQNTELNEELKMELLQQKSQQLTQLSAEYIALTQDVQEALKNAGIDDPGILMSVLA